ncbi:molybdopterin-dependent oxidoreductase [Shewanella alkalitolerans]|uniref:molybdopterin-dependent oxidoreductase n=1 Tax=Shewanella alkalitolerans TaxID=2864209 RepID=UPI001C658709|nr:molybdopterin-dependent oxidoreductase [Shewanella alkalitolerans]QYJ97913.1 molybdopterin-dependent oxidoreductase [Shewanella alkalitolerans]
MKMNRRTFLQGVGASSVVGSLSGLMPGIASAGERGGAPDKLLKREGEIIYHSCLRNCADRCLLKCHVQNGRMTYVAGAEEQRKTGTAPCIKGHTYVQYTYAPDRILHPMARVGAKGEGKWRRISWDEAYKTISDRLKKIIAEDGSDAILPYSYSGNYGTIGMYGAGERFFNKLNSRILDRNVCIHAGLHGVESAIGTAMGPDPEQVIHADCYISYGWNEPATNVHFIKYINQARDKGTKLVVVNPVRTAMASQADLFVQIKPGTDVHFCAGVMKYLIDNNLHDMEFIEKNVLGWEDLQEQLKEITLDEVVRVTGVPLDTLKKFAHMYADSKRVMMRLGHGLQRNINGGRICRAIAIMQAVAGQYGKLGNGLVYDNGQALIGGNCSLVKGKHLRTDPNATHVNITEIAKALDPVNPTAYGKPSNLVKACIFYNGNPAAMAPDADAVLRHLKREDLFLVGFDFNMHDSMDVCDIILPSSTQFEADDVIGSYGFQYVQVCEKVIDTLGESKDNWTFFRELAKHMGFTDPEFDDTNHDMIRQFLQTDDPFFEGITYERLMKEKSIKIDVGIYFDDGKYPTASGKIEFHSEMLKEEGYHPVLDFGLPEDEMIASEKALPFRMVSPAIAHRMNCEFYNVEYVRNYPAYMVTINPEDAAKLNIKNGDKVRLSNFRGEAFLTASVSTQVNPGIVMTVKNNLRRFNPNGSNTCTNILTTDTLTDLGGCSAYHSTNVALEKA